MSDLIGNYEDLKILIYKIIMNHKLLQFRYYLFNYHDREIRSELLFNWILSTYYFSTDDKS